MVRIANIVTDEKFIDNLIELNDNICHSDCIFCADQYETKGGDGLT